MYFNSPHSNKSISLSLCHGLNINSRPIQTSEWFAFLSRYMQLMKSDDHLIASFPEWGEKKQALVPFWQCVNLGVCFVPGSKVMTRCSEVGTPILLHPHRGTLTSLRSVTDSQRKWLFCSQAPVQHFVFQYSVYLSMCDVHVYKVYLHNHGSVVTGEF